MSGLMVVAALSLGVEVGWQPLAGGGFEYIVQIEPQMLESLRAGESIISEIPPELRGVRRYRLVVGTGPLPRIGTPPAAERSSADHAGRSIPAVASTSPAAGPASGSSGQGAQSPSAGAGSVLERVRAARAQGSTLASPPAASPQGDLRPAPDARGPAQSPPSGSLMLRPDPRDAPPAAAAAPPQGTPRLADEPYIGSDASAGSRYAGGIGPLTSQPQPAGASGSSGFAAMAADRAGANDPFAHPASSPSLSEPAAVGQRYASPSGVQADPFVPSALHPAPPGPLAPASPTQTVGDRYADRYAGSESPLPRGGQAGEAPSRDDASRWGIQDAEVPAVPRVFDPAPSPRLASYNAPAGAATQGAGTPTTTGAATQGAGAAPQGAAAPSSPPGAASPAEPSSAASTGADAPGVVAAPSVALGASWLVALALFASLGGNAYLAWTLWHVRLRYRAVIDRWKHRRKPVLVLGHTAADAA
jgi:hypothetical protein